MTFEEIIYNESKKTYFIDLMNKVKEEYKTNQCFPPYSNLFYAFKVTPLEKVKVVILGQDPYHDFNQAHGLAFSTLDTKLPPSLVNIYKEMESDLGVCVNQDGNLDYLAKQGVLLLNTVMSVQAHKPNSHKNFGWQTFTDNIIKLLNDQQTPIVFILWGAPSAKKESLITNPIHKIIKSAHPSPLSAYRGFFGSKCFSKTNDFLTQNNLTKINWIKA